MALPRWVEWLVAAATLLAAGLAALGIAAMEAKALAPWHIHLLVTGWLLFLSSGLLLVGGLLSPFFRGVAAKVRATRGRKARVAGKQEEAAAMEARRQRKLHVAVELIVGAWNRLADLSRLYRQAEKETWDQANAREQMKADEERELFKRLRHHVKTEYYFAFRELAEPVRQIHQSIYDRLIRVDSVADLRGPIRELFAIVFPERATPRPATSPQPPKASEQAPPSSLESSE